MRWFQSRYSPVPAPSRCLSRADCSASAGSRLALMPRSLRFASFGVQCVTQPHTLQRWKRNGPGHASRQNVRNVLIRRSGAEPAIRARLFAPIEVPMSQSGSKLCSCSASSTPHRTRQTRFRRQDEHNFEVARIPCLLGVWRYRLVFFGQLSATARPAPMTPSTRTAGWSFCACNTALDLRAWTSWLPRNASVRGA